MKRKRLSRCITRVWRCCDRLELVQAVKLDPSVVVSHRPPLEDVAHAYSIFNEKKARPASSTGSWRVLDGVWDRTRHQMRPCVPSVCGRTSS